MEAEEAEEGSMEAREEHATQLVGLEAVEVRPGQVTELPVSATE
jgi:hypothetical protein